MKAAQIDDALQTKFFEEGERLVWWRDEPGEFGPDRGGVHEEDADEEGGIHGGVRPAVEARPDDGSLVGEDGELSIDPVGHGEGEEEPEEGGAVIDPGQGDEEQ